MTLSGGCCFIVLVRYLIPTSHGVQILLLSRPKKSTRLSLKCSAWKGFINFATKKISKEILGLNFDPKKKFKKIWLRKFWV